MDIDRKAAGQRALVLGATGGIGGEMARQLAAAGWQVRALRRNAPDAPVAAKQSARVHGVEWIAGDAMRRDDVLRAASGCQVIVHAVNPPGYQRWSELVLPMIDNTIAAAQAEGARIVLPGTVYNFGPDAFPLLREASPQRPLTRKGAIRVEMENRLRVASSHGARTLVVRAGDFFGPQARSSWFSQAVVKPGHPVRAVTVPAGAGVGHQWAYLPDVARTMVELLQRDDSLDPFAAFHMAGHWDADGLELARAVQRVVSRHGLRAPKVKRFPWWLLTAASPFVPLLREMQEMRYLWQQPVRMANERLLEVLGHEPHTPLDTAVEATLLGLGCLPASAAAGHATAGHA